MKFDETLKKLVKDCLNSNNIPMLLGEPGIGKSSFFEAIAKELHTKCFTFSCNQLADKADVTGARLVPCKKTIKQPDGSIKEEDDFSQQFYPHKTIKDAINYALANPREKPILFMDELNRTTPDVTSELLSIPTARTIGNETLPENLRIVAAGNDKGNITALDKASVSRFVFIHVVPDTRTFLAIHADLNPFIRNVLTKHPESIYGTKLFAIAGSGQNDDDEEEDITAALMEASDDMSQITTPRTLAGLSRYLNLLDQKDILQMIQEIHTNEEGKDESTFEEVIQGFVGNTQFTAFLIEEVTNNIMTVNATATNDAYPKPMIYDAMKAVTDATELMNFIVTMTEKERNECLLYALCENADNSFYVKTLAENINALDQDIMKDFATQYSKNAFDKENAYALLQTNKPFVQAVSIMLM